MSKAELIEQELNKITQALKAIGDWVDSPYLRRSAGMENMEMRMFQRRLKDLLDRGAIEKTGSKTGTKYRMTRGSQQVVQEVVVAQPETPVPRDLQLSAEAIEIEELVTKPEDQRKAVGYNHEWMMSYRPNEDYYLSVEERAKLHKIGSTSTGDQPAGTYARQMLQRLLIDLSWNSSRLEGNTYSLLDTQRLLADGQAAEKKDPAETQMIINHKEAIEFIVDNAGETGLNPYTIRNLHGILSYNLLPDPSAPGRLREYGVSIGKSVYTPLALGAQIKEMFERVLEKAEAIRDPFEQAFFVMTQLPYLQPFEDVNKRVSRLAANIPLNKANLVPLSFIDVPKDKYIRGLLGVYELNRVTLLKEVFIWAYDRSAKQYATVQQTLGEPDPFRLRHTNTIRTLISQIIANNMTREDANQLIEEKAAELPVGDRARFSESVATDMLNLHEGNFGRYRVSPKVFHAWQQHWGLG